jgi:hypothetical protein
MSRVPHVPRFSESPARASTRAGWSCLCVALTLAAILGCRTEKRTDTPSTGATAASARADHIHLTVEDADAPLWYAVVTRKNGSPVRVPTSGMLHTHSNYTASIGPSTKRDIAFALYRCSVAADKACRRAPSSAVATATGFLITGVDTGAARRLRLAVSFDAPVATDSAAGSVPASDVIAIAPDANARAGAFTTRAGENHLQLRAQPPVSVAAGIVTWHIRGINPAEGWVLEAEPGASTIVELRPPPRSRWSSVKHPGDLSRKALALEVTASTTVDGRTLTSAPLVLHQDEISAIRQEYVDLGVGQGIPKRSDFVNASGSHSSLSQQVANNGDYRVFMVNRGFVAALDSMADAWGQPSTWQVNGFYRNPVHNAYHVARGKSSGTVPASWHQYGCAADLQVFPSTDGTSPHKDSLALAFWHAMASLAQDQGFRVEPLIATGHSFSGLGHVHVERRCAS